MAQQKTALKFYSSLRFQRDQLLDSLDLLQHYSDTMKAQGMDKAAARVFNARWQVTEAVAQIVVAMGEVGVDK